MTTKETPQAEPKTVKTEFPAHLLTEVTGGGLARFEARGDVEDPYRGVRIAHDIWVELGEPEVITVTLEPGDRLNQ